MICNFLHSPKRLYVNDGQWGPQIDAMIFEFFNSDDVSISTEGKKRKWKNPQTNKTETKVKRVCLFPSESEAWEYFKEIYGSRINALMVEKGHQKRLFPSAKYVWSKKPSYVV